MKLGDFTPNLANPRKCDDKALERLKKTLTKHGDLSGFVVNRRSGQIVSGHQRAKVLPKDAEVTLIKEFETPTAKGTVAVGYVEIDGELHPFRLVDIDEDKEKQYNLAANKGAGEWDKPALAEWMLELDAKGYEVEDTGFSLEEFEDLCAPWKEDEEEKVDADEESEDEKEEEPEKLQGQIQIFNDDCLTVLRSLPKNHFDSLVTDPPAGISFMGKDWDGAKGGRESWTKWMTEVMQEVLRVLKPGAHGLVWAIPRTSHWTGNALEEAGFEVRDVVTHLFGTGFPKSLDISKAIDKAAGVEREVVATRVKNTGTHYYENGAKMGNANYGVRQGDDKIKYEDVNIPVTEPATPEAKQWDGWGTALKPACEFWFLVRKPISENTVAANVLKWGTGGINVDGCRIGTSDKMQSGRHLSGRTGEDQSFRYDSRSEYQQNNEGRFPANLTLDETAAEMLDEQSAPQIHSAGKARSKGQSKQDGDGALFGVGNHDGNGTRFGDEGGASRFFYVAKASKSERNEHCGEDGSSNGHPTVKPVSLMRYLSRLITPPNGLVLDPFMGSGTTGVATLKEGFRFVGIEREQEYFVICRKRLNAEKNDAQLVS